MGVSSPGVREAFDGRDRGAVGLDGEEQAGAHRVTVQEDGAGPADSVLAAEVGAGECAVLAEEVGEGLAGLDGRVARRSPLTVDRDGPFRHGWPRRGLG